jgi:hypothetical protein
VPPKRCKQPERYAKLFCRPRNLDIPEQSEITQEKNRKNSDTAASVPPLRKIITFVNYF